MNLIEQLDTAQAALTEAEQQVITRTQQLNALKAQIAAKYCPFRIGDAVPLSANRFIRLDQAPEITRDAQGVWHWSVHSLGCFDVRDGVLVPLSSGLYHKKYYSINDDTFNALPADIRNATPDSMIAASLAAKQAKAAKPVVLNTVDKQLLAALPPAFAEGTAVLCPFEVEGLTRKQIEQGWRRLAKKAVIEVCLGRPSINSAQAEHDIWLALQPYGGTQIKAGAKFEAGETVA